MIRIEANFKKSVLHNRQFKKIFESEFKRTMHAVVLDLETKIAKATPVNFGIARAGVIGKVINAFTGVVRAQGAAIKYIEFVERGRRPGKWPPREPIERWVRRKLRPPDLKSVTFLVQRKIGQKGTKGAFMFRDTEKRERRNIQTKFRQAAKRVERRASK